MNPEVRTRADLVRELRATKDAGLSEDFLRDCGIASIEACAAELRFAGYEVEVQADGGGKRLVLTRAAGVAARERRRAWQQLFDPTPGAYGGE